MGQVTSHARKPFDNEEFKVAWLAFKGEMCEVGSRGRAVASKSGLNGSKFLRSIYGDSFMDDLINHIQDNIPREHFIALLALYYMGNTEDKLGYLFHMYGSIYGLERNDDGTISNVDIECFFEYMALYSPVPEELIQVFDECKLGKEISLSFSVFTKWVRQYPSLMKSLAIQLPPVLDDIKTVLSVRIPDPFELTDPLNVSPSMKQHLRHHQSFDIVGGDSSDDSDGSILDSDAESIDTKKIPSHPPSPESQKPSSQPSSPPKGSPISPPLSNVPPPHSNTSPSLSSTSPPKDFDIPITGFDGTVPSHKKSQKGKNPIGKFGRAVGGGIRTMLQPQKGKGQRPSSTHATMSIDNENHHYIGGYLNKVSDGKWAKRNWHLRWFVLDLERGILSYYKSNPSSIVHSPHGSVAFYDDFDLNFINDEKIKLNQKPHPWYRGFMDLNQPNVSLLFDKQYGHNAPNKFIFQVSNQSIGEMETKRGFQYKLCANSEDEFMQWTSAIAEVINRKHIATKPKETLQQQLHRQKLQEPIVQDGENNSIPKETIEKNCNELKTIQNDKKPEIKELNWQFQIKIQGQNQCYILLAIVNLWFFITFLSFGYLIQIPMMGLATIYIIRHIENNIQPDTIPRVHLKPLESNHSCHTNGICCLHSIPEEIHVEKKERIESTNFQSNSFQFQMLSTCNESENEEIDENAWSNTNANTFNIRSKDYKKSKKKEPSQPALLDFLGIDVIRTNSKIDSIAKHIIRPISLESEHLFILHAQMPMYAPSLFNSTYDGLNASIIMYWKIPKNIQERLNQPDTPALHLFQRFLDSKNDISILERFKVIAQVVNENECGLNGYTKKLLQKNNATPVLTRPQHRIYHTNEYTEVDVDVHIFSLVARTGINALIDKTSQMIIDISFVLQGEHENELPEQILGVCRLVRMDLTKAKKY